MAATAAAKNKALRQNALREQLSNQKHVEHVIEISKKLHKQHIELEPSHIQALRAAAEIKLKLINKYLPDLKAMELSGPEGGPIDNKWTVEYVNATPESK